MNRKRRVAISELMGTLIMVSITLIAGAAVFGWVNGQAGTSESAYGASVANNVNFLRERFSTVSQSFSATGLPCSGGCTDASFWLYNSGQVDFTLYTIRVVSLSSSYPLNILFYSSCTLASANCGFIAYNSAGAQICSDNAALPTLTGFYQNVAPFGQPPVDQPPSTLPQGSLSTNPYLITMPTASTCSAGALYLYDGIAYTFTFTGLYGNTYTTTVTING